MLIFVVNQFLYLAADVAILYKFIILIITETCVRNIRFNNFCFADVLRIATEFISDYSFF